MNITKRTRKQTMFKYGAECDVSTNCKKCRECCKRGSGYVLKEDIAQMAEKMKMDRKDFVKRYLDAIELYGKVLYKLKLKKYPYGECILLTDDGCKIHSVKPTYCKIGTWHSKTSQQCHDWFVLNYIVDKDKPETIRQWAQYLQFNNTIPGGELNEIVPDKKELDNVMRRKK